MCFDRILERTLAAEAAGFDSVWLMDHFAAPMAPEVDTFEGWTVATALAARTSTIRIGHLVLCDPFRHPALLAKMAATLRRDLGRPARARHRLGIGARRARSTFGFGPEPAGDARGQAARDARDPRADVRGRAVRLRRASTSRCSGAIGRPVPVQARVPVHIGGGGPKLTMPLVERFADWWNCPGYALDRIDELRPLAGNARISTQHPIGLALDAATRDEVIATVHRRFGSWGGVIAGTADEVARRARGRGRTRGVDGFVLPVLRLRHARDDRALHDRRSRRVCVESGR